MKTRLKVGLLTDNHPDSGGAGGIGTYTKFVAEELARLGHEPHVFTPAATMRHGRRQINGVTLWECPDWSKRSQMPPLKALEFTVRYKARADVLGRYSLMTAVREACKSGSFDLIESPEIGAMGSLVENRKFTHRMAVRLHKPSNLPFNGSNLPPEGPWTERNDWERDLALRADVITVPTESARRAISNFWKTPLENARVVGSPMRGNALVPYSPADPFSAVYFGRFEPRKGVDTFARSIAQVKARFPQFKATFIGGNNNWPRGGTGMDVITDIAAKAGVSNAINFVPQTPNSQLAAIVRKSAVCVLPSRAETFGIVFAEAMLWGVPCVASDIGPFRELAGDSSVCHFAPPEDSAVFAERICDLLADPANAAALAQRAHAHAQQWTVERLVPQLLNAWMN